MMRVRVKGHTKIRRRQEGKGDRLHMWGNEGIKRGEGTVVALEEWGVRAH